ncbi:MAG: non-canonical purine NTP pyrophosphatase, RdgB/HAM1 family [Candidatus Marinimicrobia bacterium]|nr:non-canonical purine NTP pyrophosphatase, RdgB/HAM1 family [Candidatus Neomarinimicrobiota bacterium]|tara:strand:+ start:123 stop:728 length:606 start_codon:yes stop_codon:yes gene_type:complete
MEIILATHNLDKCKEMQVSFNDTNIKIFTLKNFPEIDDIVEDGDTLEANAFIKSRTVFNKTGIPTISDDTGLFISALNGEPGIFSARYSGENCSYMDNVNKVLIEMNNIDRPLRKATFKTVVTYVSKDLELVAEGSVKGIITKKPKGNKGFGYDPIFYVPELQKTFAEMDINEKQKISHRSRAIDNLQKLFRENKLFSNQF